MSKARLARLESLNRITSAQRTRVDSSFDLRQILKRALAERERRRRYRETTGRDWEPSTMTPENQTKLDELMAHIRSRTHGG